MTPGDGRRRGQGRQPARPRRRRLPGRREVGLPARRTCARATSSSTATRASRGTYKDRMLMERDPHQLIEGIAHRVLRGRLPPRRSSTSAARWRSAQERIAQALNEAYAAGYVGKNILGSDFSRRHRPALGRRRLHRRRGDGAHREPRGQPGHAAAQAAVLPGGQGPVPAADDRQQRRDAVEPPVDHQQRAARRSPRSAPRPSTGTRMFAVSGHVKQPGRATRSSSASPPSAT